MAAPSLLSRIAGALGFVRASRGGYNWYWPGGNGDKGPPGEWQSRSRQYNTESLASFSAVYACVQIISEDLSKLPISFYDIMTDGTRRMNTRYPTNALIRKPNHYQTRVQFIQNFVVSYLMKGNTYVYLHYDNRNLIDEMHVLDPDRVFLHVHPQTGEIFYRVSAQPLAGIFEQALLPARYILHHRLILSPSQPLMGVTPIYAAAASSQSGQTILANSQQFFGNAARPGGYLTSEQRISPETAQRMKEDWDNSYSQGRVGKTAVLGEGLTFNAMTMNYVDSQLIEQLRFSIEDVARVFRVPPFMIGELGKTTFRNVEQLSRTYLAGCLAYHIKSIEESLDAVFEFEGTMKTVFDLDELLRAEMDLRYTAYQQALLGGWQTINEVRKKEGMAPIENGDEPMVQAQLVPLSIAVDPPEPVVALPPPTDPNAPKPPKPPSSNDPAPKDDDEEDKASIDAERVRKLIRNKLLARGFKHAA